MKTFFDRYVSLRDEAGGGEGGGTGAAAGGGVDVAALQAELAAAKKLATDKDNELKGAKQTIAEKEEAAKFWHGKATQASGATRQAQEPEPEDNVDLLDVIGTKGVSGLKAVLKKAGFVSEAEVQERIAQTVDQVTREGKAVERFPELKDQTSELFKLTKSNIAELGKMGIKGVTATELAAERAYIQLVDEGKLEPKAVRDAKARAAAEAGDDDEDENDRIVRANAAGGTAGRRSQRNADPASRETPEDKALVSRVCAAFGIDEKDYRKRAYDTGVRVGR